MGSGRWTAGVIGGIIALIMLLVAGGCGDEQKVEKLDPIPANQVLQKAVDAMQKPQSFHFVLESNDVIKKSSLSGGPWLIRMEGSAAKPDRLTGQLDARIGSYNFRSDVVVAGDKQYWTDPVSSRWGPMPEYFNLADFFTKGVNEIVQGLRNPSVEATENVQNTTSYRVKGSVPATALKALSAVVTATGDINAVIWIGGRDFLVRMVRLDGKLFQEEPQEASRTITIDKFDEPVTVQTPQVVK